MMARAAAGGKRAPTKKSAGPKVTSAATPTRTYQVCETCGLHNSLDAKSCSGCSSKRFARGWVRELRRVNRSFSVQVTDPHPTSASSDPPITLYKWWPGGKASFNIPTAQQWERVKAIIDFELSPIVGWPQPSAAVGSSTPSLSASDESAELTSLAHTEPLRLAKALKAIDLSKVTDNDVEQISEVLGDIAEVLVGADEGLRRAISRLVAQLPVQGQSALQELSTLMESLTVAQIANVTREVNRRLGLLDLFKQRALDDRTYEIRGSGSIHRLLEQAMWIVDERYWLMHSNETLRTVVGNRLAKDDQQFAKTRPDFVCGTVDRKLILIELKRPSHTLGVSDLNQLERYVVLCDEYSTEHSSFEAILVGSKQSDDLRRTLKVRGGTRFQVRTYTDLISDSERRYQSYLKALQPESDTPPKRTGRRAR